MPQKHGCPQESHPTHILMREIPMCVCRCPQCIGSPQEGWCLLNPWDQSNRHLLLRWKAQVPSGPSFSTWHPMLFTSCSPSPQLLTWFQLSSFTARLITDSPVPKRCRFNASGPQGTQAGDGRKTMPCPKTALFESKKNVLSLG